MIDVMSGFSHKRPLGVPRNICNHIIVSQVYLILSIFVVFTLNLTGIPEQTVITDCSKTGILYSSII